MTQSVILKNLRSDTLEGSRRYQPRINAKKEPSPQRPQRAQRREEKTCSQGGNEASEATRIVVTRALRSDTLEGS
jgi:hypothetical protein